MPGPQRPGRRHSASDLHAIPGLGPGLARDLRAIGVLSAAHLRDKDADELYTRLCVHRGSRLDRALLYVLRCAIYRVSTRHPKPELLKWWNWRDPGDPLPFPVGGSKRRGKP